MLFVLLQFFAAVRVAPTPLQPKGLTREFVLPVEVPCNTASSRTTLNGTNTAAFIRSDLSQPSASGRTADGGGENGKKDIKDGAGANAQSSSSSRNGTKTRGGRSTPQDSGSSTRGDAVLETDKRAD